MTLVLTPGHVTLAELARIFWEEVAIALDPALIIADEPTAGLDVSVQGEVLNLLNDLRERLGLAMVIITHNLHVVHHIFPTIPHYRLQEATDAIKPILGEYYRYSDRFVVTEFISSQLRCHFVVPDDGFERYGSAYKWLRPRT